MHPKSSEYDCIVIGGGPSGSTTASLVADAGQIRIDEFAVDLGGLRARGGAVIRLDRARPGVGLKVAAERVDTALFVGGGKEEPSSAAGSQNVDFSALGLVNANVDLSAKEVLIGAVPVADLGVDIQIVDGDMSASIRSARRCARWALSRPPSSAQVSKGL